MFCNVFDRSLIYRFLQGEGRRPSSSSNGENRLEFDVEILREEGFVRTEKTGLDRK